MRRRGRPRRGAAGSPPDRGDTGVPKAGKLLELFRLACESFMPESSGSIDEATAKYGGRMTHLKHLQSKYKPCDGIRAYCLNGSKTGYLFSFIFDLRDGTSVHEITERLLEKVHRVGVVLERLLREVAGRRRHLGQVTGRGLMLGLDLVTDTRSRRPAPELAAWLLHRMKVNHPPQPRSLAITCHHHCDRHHPTCPSPHHRTTSSPE